MHHDCSPPVIRSYIKSSSILLDEDYEAKIADFDVTRFAGTHGYIAPGIMLSTRNFNTLFLVSKVSHVLFTQSLFVTSY